MSTTTAIRKPRQRRPHERSVKVLLPAVPGLAPPVVRITQDGAGQTYTVWPLATDFGLGFRLAKDGAEAGADDAAYDVLLEHDGASCTCPGHTYGHYCKHVDALKALMERGLLPLPIITNTSAPAVEAADLPAACEAAA